MRDALHIFGLFAVFAFLALQFPKGAVLVEKESAERAPFAEFVTLSPNAHAVYLDAARTSWQVKNEARSRPSIGRLDADVPLLSELLPPPSLTLASLPSSDTGSSCNPCAKERRCALRFRVQDVVRRSRSCRS